MMDLAGRAPPVLHSFLAQALFATRLFNVTITNVPGPQQPLYAFGSRMTAVWPIVPLAACHAVGVAAFSYDGDAVPVHQCRPRLDRGPLGAGRRDHQRDRRAARSRTIFAQSTRKSTTSPASASSCAMIPTGETSVAVIASPAVSFTAPAAVT